MFCHFPLKMVCGSICCMCHLPNSISCHQVAERVRFLRFGGGFFQRFGGSNLRKSKPGSWFWCRCTVPSGTSGTSLGIQFLRWWKLAPLGQQSTGDQSTTVVPSTWVRPPWGTKHDPICRIVGNLSNLNSWKVTWMPKMMVFKMHLLSSKEV